MTITEEMLAMAHALYKKIEFLVMETQQCEFYYEDILKRVELEILRSMVDMGLYHMELHNKSLDLLKNKEGQ